MDPIILVIGGVVLVVVGVGIGYGLAQLLRKGEASKAEEIQTELDDYRRQVTEHFGETAEHFQALGQQYRSLYKHMAGGAEALCDASASDGKLAFPAAATESLSHGIEVEAAVPEPIRDYAPEEPESAVETQAELDDTELAASAELSESDEPSKSAEPADSTEPSDPTDKEPEIAATDEADTEEAATDSVSATAPKESERTVH